MIDDGRIRTDELLKQYHGVTVLVSSHLLAEMQALADDAVTVAAGRLVRQWPVAEVAARVPSAMDQVQALTPEPDLLARALRSPGAVTRSADAAAPRHRATARAAGSTHPIAQPVPGGPS